MYKNENLIQELQQCIIDCSNNIESNKILGDYEWTRQIKSFIGRLGISKGYKVCASSHEQDFENEWLYDLVWYKENDTGFLIDVPLVVESEWKQNLKDIKFDFEKLLLANSGLKLMICNSKEKHKQSILNYFQEAIEFCPFIQISDEYLVAILDLIGSDADKFTFHVFKKH